jgi:hypothetical protein
MLPRVIMRVLESVTSTGHGADDKENTSCQNECLLARFPALGMGGRNVNTVACVYFGRCVDMGLHVTVFYASKY